MAGKTGPPLRPLYWMGSSKNDLIKLSEDVKDLVGFALEQAQAGERHPDAKPLSGFGDRQVLEVVANDPGGTYRAVYTVRLAHAVYVLHVFQKKSVSGIKTPQRDIDLIRQRLKAATEHHRNHYEQQGKQGRKGGR